jgi:hypothetical protein
LYVQKKNGEIGNNEAAKSYKTKEEIPYPTNIIFMLPDLERTLQIQK